MDDTEQTQKISVFKDKLARAQRQLAGLREKGKYLHMQYEDARTREKNTNELIMELLERQRELNVMLNRANIMLNRTQEAMALTSIEFNEMAKALPEPRKAEWSSRVSRINDLFKKSGGQDAELVDLQVPNPPTAGSLDSEELKHESQEAFHRKESIWARKGLREPTRVQAELVEEAPATPTIEVVSAEPDEDDGNASRSDDEIDENTLAFPPHRKSWWRRAAG